MKNTRQIAAEALCRLDLRDAWSNRTLDSFLQKYKLEPRDSAFVSAQFYGVLERSITLDACIAAHSKTKPHKLDPVVRSLLRLGIYQLLYMDSVPDHAAVDECVDLTRKMKRPRASGLVNAVLRSFLRAEKAIPLEGLGDISRLSVEYSCPEELISLWSNAYGREQAQSILADSLKVPPLFLRVNTLKTTSEQLAELLEKRGLTCRPDHRLPHCLVLEQQGAVHNLPEYTQGMFHVQDYSSQQCAAALGAMPGERILDACAAPGGKSFTLAQIMENHGEIIAADLHDHRTGLIEKGAARLGIDIIIAETADMTSARDSLGLFDRVICDVPCSGFGTIRRRPEIKHKTMEEISQISSLQYKILETTSQYCKEGGVLLYSTCTLNPVENNQVVERFLSTHPEFVPKPLPGGMDQRTVFPGECGADGFYMALMTRKGECIG